MTAHSSGRGWTYLIAFSACVVFFFGLPFVRLNPPPTVDIALWVLMLPGLSAAAILFPTGEHSDYGETYLWLSLLINSVVYAIPVRWTLEYLVARKGRTR